MSRSANPNKLRVSNSAAFEAVEVSIRRMRLLAAGLFVGLAVGGRSGVVADIDALDWVLLFGLPVVLMATNWVSRLIKKWPEHTTAMIITQLGADTVVTVAALWVLAPERGSYALVATGIPVLHGALRYRLSGAFGVWLVVAAGLCLRVIVNWTPGTGLQPLFDLGVPLAIALAASIPAGHLADQLSEEILGLRIERHVARRQSRLLAVLTVADQDLTSRRRSELAEATVNAAVELGYEGAAVIASDPDHEQVVFASAGTADTDPFSGVLPSYGAIGKLRTESDGVWKLLLQAEPRRYSLLVRLTSGDEWPARAEALELLGRKAAAAFATAQGFADLQLASQRLHIKATHDPLTGLLNRAGLDEAFAKRQNRDPEDMEPFALLVLDLNGFKAVNDTYGHDAGDAVLVALAGRLTAIDTSQVVVRQGGDEFVILSELDSDGGVEKLVAAISDAVDQPFRIDGHVLTLGAAVGGSIVRRADVKMGTAISEADAKMYSAKRVTTQHTSPLSQVD